MAPMQGNEGAPEAWLVFDERVATGLDGLSVRRRCIRPHMAAPVAPGRAAGASAHDRSNPERGVFTTRSPERPNPIGLHRARVLRIEGLRVQVRNLEAIDGTPVVDVKPVVDADCHEG